jgi:dolichol-phosphate mannosyltransferase
MNSEIRTAILIPSFCEEFALPKLLTELKFFLSESDLLVIVDDSPKEISALIHQKCKISLQSADCSLYFDNVSLKSGRGSAVRRGMEYAIKNFPHLEYVLECDADGSHRAIDIAKIKNETRKYDLLVGSRYLPLSRIEGWPVGRRIFSLILNMLIPRLINVPIRDITNGLRRYSTVAVKKILECEQENKGFIYLSEQALIVRNSNLEIAELPITFVNRTLGQSTVTVSEVTQSIIGIIGLFKKSRR